MPELVLKHKRLTRMNVCDHRMWTVPEAKGLSKTSLEDEKLKLVSEGCDPKIVSSITILWNIIFTLPDPAKSYKL